MNTKTELQTISFGQAVKDGLTTAMELDPSVICYGLGVDDPKGIFGTTLGLQERFGEQRVFDMPTSENAMTGVAVGASLNGIRPVMVHQRLDFFLLAMDQLVNNAAKWRFMFGGQNSVPITIRLIIGRGWGQGPTHSQNLASWFTHIPGLKVVMPTTPADAKGLLIESIFDDNPVLFLEHRWLHETRGEVPAGDFRIPIGPASVVREGSDVTIVSMSLMTIEAIRAAEHLAKKNISAEVIDLRSVAPLDWKTVLDSVKKTGRLIAVDTAAGNQSIASEIVARASMELFSDLKSAPKRIALDDEPIATSHWLTENVYRRAEDIVEAAGEIFGVDVEAEKITQDRDCPHDVPGDWFKGPF